MQLATCKGGGIWIADVQSHGPVVAAQGYSTAQLLGIRAYNAAWVRWASGKMNPTIGFYSRSTQLSVALADALHKNWVSQAGLAYDTWLACWTEERNTGERTSV